MLSSDRLSDKFLYSFCVSPYQLSSTHLYVFYKSENSALISNAPQNSH